MSSNLRSARRTALLRRCGLALAGFVAAVMMVSQNAHASTWRTCEGNILVERQSHHNVLEYRLLPDRQRLGYARPERDVALE
jgi:hypothetical protein